MQIEVEKAAIFKLRYISEITYFTINILSLIQVEINDSLLPYCIYAIK